MKFLCQIKEGAEHEYYCDENQWWNIFLFLVAYAILSKMELILYGCPICSEDTRMVCAFLLLAR